MIDLSKAVVAANKRLGTDNLYAFMGTPIRIGFLVKNPDPRVGNDIDLIFESADPALCVEFLKTYEFPPEFPTDDHIGPRTELYGRLVIAEDWEGNEIGRGPLTEIVGVFDFKLGETWYSIGESYNFVPMGTPLKLIGAWKV